MKREFILCPNTTTTATPPTPLRTNLLIYLLLKFNRTENKQKEIHQKHGCDCIVLSKVQVNVNVIEIGGILMNK